MKTKMKAYTKLILTCGVRLSEVCRIHSIVDTSLWFVGAFVPEAQTIPPLDL